MGPNTAFVMLIGGMLGIYAELVWPGRFVPGILGLGGTLAGAYFLFHPPLNLQGIGLLALATVLLIAEALWGPYFLLGSLGTIALASGFSLLLGQPRHIEPALAVPLSIVFGLCSALLAASAKRARRNKRSDLTGVK